MTQHKREIYNSDYRDNQIARDNNIASTGLLLGIFLVGLGVGVFFLNQETNLNSNKTTIIQKTQKAVPVSQPKAPDVNVNISSSPPQNNPPASEPATAKP
jgi:hypothetical protein